MSMPVPEKTQVALESHLPRVVALLAHEYLLPRTNDQHAIGVSGHGELCQNLFAPNSGLLGICKAGHVDLIDVVIGQGANNWDYGMYNACANGHREIAMMMMDHGANVNTGLSGACEGGHRELVDLMIEHGADYWNGGLSSAAYGGHREIVDMMIAHGANDWNRGLTSSCRTGRHDLVELMISYGATHCSGCLMRVDHHKKQSPAKATQ